MIRITVRRTAVGALMVGLGACGALDVSDPTAIEDSDVATATGADLLRRDAVVRLYTAVSNVTMTAGLLADEFTGYTFSSDGPDRRDEQQLLSATASSNSYVFLQDARRAATVAMPMLQAHGAPGAARPHTGEMFAVRGFAALALAENFCPGFPLHDIVDFKPVYGGPLSTEQAFEHALADFDSALAYAADSARILDLARIGRGRALLGLGRFADAAAGIAPVLTSYVWHAEYNNASAPSQGDNFIGLRTESAIAGRGFVSVTDQEGGSGVNFISADDPRLVTNHVETPLGPLAEVYVVAKYPDRRAPIVIASGIEARLIEAEAALNGNPESGDWLAILNTLRTDGTQDANGVYNPGTGGVAGLAPLADPTTTTAREDLLFRERAFWLFGTGHRLGDLRRLIRHYGRSSESVLPTGPYPQGGVYGNATSIPFQAEVEGAGSPGCTGP